MQQTVLVPFGAALQTSSSAIKCQCSHPVQVCTNHLMMVLVMVLSLLPSCVMVYVCRCKHCKRLLTSEQDNLLPCTTQKYNQYLATETSLYSGTPYCTPYSGTPGPVQWNPIIVVPLYSGTLYCGTPVQWNPHTVEPPYCGTPVQWNPIEWNPRPCTVEPHSMVPTRVFYVLPMYYRLSICTSGKMVYSHELCPSWSINSYIQSLQQTDGLTPRDLYWRIWSLVNMLQCEECHTPFQCCDLMQCSYHPEGTPCHSKNGKATYPCCSQPAAQFSLIPSAQVW